MLLYSRTHDDGDEGNDDGNDDEDYDDYDGGRRSFHKYIISNGVVYRIYILVLLFIHAKCTNFIRLLILLLHIF